MRHTIRKSITVLGAFAAGAAAATMLGAAVFNQPADPGDGAMPPMDPAAMERWAAVSTPGEHHADLVAASGQWTVTSRMWMDPDADPEVSQMRSVVTPELGGRFISERITGTVMGMPFEGYGLFGYDNHKGKWTSIWVDNMNTAMFYAEGDAKDDDTIELFGEMYDPMADRVTEYRIVLSEDGPDQQTMAMHSRVDGEWVKGMEMEYRRAGGAGQRPKRDHPQGDHPQGDHPR